jgi:DNA polymerase III delta prime subunit
MNLIKKHLDKNNLHHAYLIEGMREKISLEIIEFLKSLNINTVGNPDFVNISIDNFKIDEAFSLRSMSTSKGFSSAKKIFMIYANNISLDAQNVLLKMFEEPIENTHFFLIVPDTNFLLKTFISRFYLIRASLGLVEEEVKEAEKFIAMSLKDRIDFIKELLMVQNEEEDDIAPLDSTRFKALKFLNALEISLHSNFVKNFEHGRFHPEDGVKWKNSLQSCFLHFFKVREFLRMPGSSTKSLMESVALITPNMLQ